MSKPHNLYSSLPTKPGVYSFKDAAGTILYVGKANNLKSRVSSYFLGSQTDRPWIAVMIGLIDSVETIVVNNEMEALMLEATLIKQHLPRFNIKLTDDKAYPYIKLTTTEAIPRFAITRRQITDKAIYFGPYLSGRAASQTLEFLRKLYGVHLSPRPLRPQDRPCLNCQLDGFACPQAGEVDQEAYQSRIQKAVDFLQGKRKSLLRDLADRMDKAAAEEKFELAAKLRDRLQAAEHVLGRQQVVSTTMDDYDVIGVATAASHAVVALLRVRDGRFVGQKTFTYQITDQPAAVIVRQFLLGPYQTITDLPPLVIIPEPIDDQPEINRLLEVLSGKRGEIRVAERGDKRQLQDLATKNAQAKLETTLLRTDQSITALIALKELLDLPELPIRIEAVDISNLGSSEPVGATVCFVSGQPDKNEYRRYKIRYGQNDSDPADGSGRNIERTPNDFAMIREVVLRRFHDTTRPVPDLFIVDGGPEQLKFALTALAESPVQPKAIISLAKKPDRVFRPGRKMPIAAPRGSMGLLLLARIRDEVHRFGIGFQRTRQRKKSLSTDD